MTAGDLRGLISAGHDSPAALKRACRVGMGRCQGRYCGHAAAEVIADAAKIPIEQVGRLRAQAPVKPLLMDALEAEA